MRAARVRIGRIRPKRGADKIALLPSARQRTADQVWDVFDHAITWIREDYAEDFAGYLIIPWTWDGRYHVYQVTEGPHPTLSELPNWAAEAVRRQNAEDDAKRALRRELQLPEDA